MRGEQGDFWSILGIAPTKDVSAIKQAYAGQAKRCHPEEDAAGFLALRRAYQSALDWAAGTQEEPAGSIAEPAEEEWSLREEADGAPNPYEGGEAITTFLDLYTGKQRKNPSLWMNYVTSAPFLDAAWDARFTSLLLEKVREVQADFLPNRECLAWLNAAYQFSGGEEFEGLEDICQIAALGPAPKKPRGNEFAILQSFLDYRRLTQLANVGRWDEEALTACREITGRYAPSYIRERCEQRVTPDCERHPAGLRVFTHFFRREDLPETVYRIVWQRLNLKSAIMGRAGVLYGPLRELALARTPGLDTEEPENFLQLNRNLDAYLAQIKADPAGEDAASAAFFESRELQKALPSPRFAAEQLLRCSKWRQEGMGEGLVRRMLDYYRAHLAIPRAQEVVSGLEGDLRLCTARRWNREDAQADPDGIPYYVQTTLRYRPLFRHWLNTAFYTARDPETGTPLLQYLEKYLPYQEAWSRRFAEREDGKPRTIAAAMGMVEIDCYPLHMEYRVKGRPVYRPCLRWEQTAQESGDWFAFLLPITAAAYNRFDEVAGEIFRRLAFLPVPENERALIAQCLAGHVCQLPSDQETGEPVPPEKALPMEISAEGGGRLYTAVWQEEGKPPVTVFRQTFSGRSVQEQLEPDCLETVRQRLEELASPTYADTSRLRELPWRIYFTPNGGEEEALLRPDLLERTPVMKAAVPLEILVSRRSLSSLLARFALGELERVEMEWSQGRLVFRRDGEKYACLYFENSFGRGDYWYALLADGEMYRTVDCENIVYLPFGMGKLPEYSIFHSVRDLLRDIGLVLGQMGRGKLESDWLWSCDVNLQNAKHKLRMAQQKLGGIPPWRGRGYHLAKFVFSRFPSELETVDRAGERTVTVLQSGSYGLAAAGLVQFMMEKLDRIRVSWSFQTQEGGTERRHLVLLRDQGKYMMFWLADGAGKALVYGADEPQRFLGHALPAGLVHGDLKRLRNGVDLLLDDIDNTEPVLSQPGQFAPVNMPYAEIRAALVHGPSQGGNGHG